MNGSLHSDVFVSTQLRVVTADFVIRHRHAEPKRPAPECLGLMSQFSMRNVPMNANRRAFLLFTGAAALSRVGRSQYVLPPQPLPNERFPPSPGQLAEIRRKTASLEARLQNLRKKNIPDESLVEAEIFHKTAVWIERFNEYFRQDSADQTLAVLDLGLARAAELDRGTSSWTTATGRVTRAFRSRVDGRRPASHRDHSRLL
jgi:hypothetical protein